MKFYEVSGFYGSGRTPCTVYAACTNSGACWYAVEGSINVNRTWDFVGDGVNVEDLQDYVHFTARQPIDSLDILADEVES